MTSPVYEPPKKRRKRSSFKRQRRAVLIVLIAFALLLPTFLIVHKYTSRTVYKDGAGNKYYISQEAGVYVMKDKDGNLLPSTSHSNSYATTYQTADGTIVSVNLSTGAYTTVAVVDTAGSETLEFKSASGSFDILMYPMLEREYIKSIRVVNEEGEFTFLQRQACTNADCTQKPAPYDEFPLKEFTDTKGNTGSLPSCPKCGYPAVRENFVIEGYELISYDPNMFSTLVTCTGYTSTYMRLDQAAVDKYGFKEYGLPENAADAKKYFVITDISGNTHKVILGDEVPSGSGYYAMYEGRSSVYILKEMEETQYSYTLSTALFSPVEAYITPTVTDVMGSTDYFDVSNFKLNTLDLPKELMQDPNFDMSTIPSRMQNVITFSYRPLELRQGTFTATTPYTGGGKYEGFSINDYMVDDCLQNLQYLTPLRTVKVFTEAECENDKALFEFAKTYGIAYAVQYTHNTARDKNNNYAPSKWTDQLIFISPLSTDDTYFLFNADYQMIVEVARTHLEFLQWDAFSWVDGDVFSGSIAYLQEMTITAPGTTLGNMHFVLDNSASITNWKPSQSNSAVPTGSLAVWMNEQTLDQKQFKLFYQTLLYSTLSGSASCSEEEQELFRQASLNEAGGYTADGVTPVLTIKMVYNSEADGSGEDIVRTYTFYKYDSGRQCFIAFNGRGSFYILQSRVTKIINDLGLVTQTEIPINPQAKK